jgi:excisionase family DNA binding protein
MKIKQNLLTIKEVAEYLGVHTSTIYKYAQQGKIPAFKLGKDWRFTRKHIDDWINNKVSGGGIESKAPRD